MSFSIGVKPSRQHDYHTGEILTGKKFASPETSLVTVVSHTIPIVNGFRQSTLNFNDFATEKRSNSIKCCDNDKTVCKSGESLSSECTELNLEQFSIDGVKSLNINASPEKVPEMAKLSGRQKKQSTLIPTGESIRQAYQKKSQKSTKSAKTKKTNLRRSVSTSNLPDCEPAPDPPTHVRRNAAKSVSPKKQITTESVHQKSSPSYHQTQITLFGVRRTARQVAKYLQMQREQDVISAIIKGEEAGMKVIITEEKGRGIISTRNFSAGEFVVEYIGELISDVEARIRETEYKKDPDLGSFMFFFTHAGQRFCVDATAETDRLGRLINHSRLNPNCSVKIVTIDGVPRLALFAKTEILPGDELLYDYGDRDKESLLAHPWLKI